MSEPFAGAPLAGGAAEFELIAYRVDRHSALRLVSAQRHRAWMDATGQHFANRCLPLLIANQAGWFVLSSHRLRASWDGGEAISSLQVEYLSGGPPYPAVSHFGHGILTWHVPFVFRTSPGWNLWVRGPTNWPKDGVVALDGIVESDWAVATFTMNWKLTRPGRPVLFDVDEPVCMVLPHRRGELEAFEPELRELGADPELQQAYEAWMSSRASFLEGLRTADPDAVRRGWEKHYFQGKTAGGSGVAAHQRKLELREFDERKTGEGEQ